MVSLGRQGNGVNRHARLLIARQDLLDDALPLGLIACRILADIDEAIGQKDQVHPSLGGRLLQIVTRLLQRGADVGEEPG